MSKMIGRDPRHPWVGGCGGGCCNTKADQRHAKRGVKQADRREIDRLIEEVDPYDERMTMDEYNAYEAQMRNWDFVEDGVYTTETGDEPADYRAKIEATW